MKRYVAQLVIGTALAGLGLLAFAAPVTYTLSTSQLSPGGFGAGGSFLAGALSGNSVTGTLKYDAQALATVTAPDGSTIYSGPSSPISNLSGTVGSFSFSDPRGFVVVANDLPVDGLQLIADPGNTSGIHNISGFTLGAYTLFNIRMFWIEGIFDPELITDFLGNQNLPNPLPEFHGRLALDFADTALLQTGVYAQSSVFFDGLMVTAIPEPETYAMLLAGLGLLGFAARRRKLKETAAA